MMSILFSDFTESGGNQRNIFTGHQSQLVEDTAQHKIGTGTDAAAADYLASKILNGFDRRTRHQLIKGTADRRYNYDRRSPRNRSYDLRSGGSNQMDVPCREGAERNVSRCDVDELYF